jgi:hypothetical protein
MNAINTIIYMKNFNINFLIFSLVPVIGFLGSSPSITGYIRTEHKAKPPSEIIALIGKSVSAPG